MTGYYDLKELERQAHAARKPYAGLISSAMSYIEELLAENQSMRERISELERDMPLEALNDQASEILRHLENANALAQDIIRVASKVRNQ
jgi:hypothetical protein